MTQATIYQIRHVASGRVYVGRTNKPKVTERYAEHRYQLRKGRHPSPRMQNAWNKYGEEAFVFEVVEVCLSTEAIDREQHYLDGQSAVFNARKKATQPNFMPPNCKEVLRERMKGNQYTKGRKMPQEEKDRRAASGRGKKRTPEQRARMSEAMTGVKHPNAPKTRPLHTDEAKRKMSEARTGRAFGPRSESAKAKISEAMKAYLEGHKGEPWGKQRSMR